MDKQRMKCYCGETYVLVELGQDGGSCESAHCTPPVPAGGLEHGTRPQHDTTPTPHRHRGGQEHY
jgi:hypothetical protein